MVVWKNLSKKKGGGVLGISFMLGIKLLGTYAGLGEKWREDEGVIGLAHPLWTVHVCNGCLVLKRHPLNT